MLPFRADRDIRTFVRTVIELPLTEFDTFALKCRQHRGASDILNSAVMIRYARNDHFERIMQIRCDFETARTLLSLAIQVHSPIVPILEDSIRIASRK